LERVEFTGSALFCFDRNGLCEISSRTLVDGHRVVLRFTDAMQIDLNCLGLKGGVPTAVKDLGRMETALTPEAAFVGRASLSL